MGQLYHRTTLLLFYLWTFLIVTDLSILSFYLILDVQHLAPLAWFPSHGPQKTLLRASKGLKRGVWAVTWLINHPLHRVYVVYSQLRVCWLKPWHFIPQKQGLMESYGELSANTRLVMDVTLQTMIGWIVTDTSVQKSTKQSLYLWVRGRRMGFPVTRQDVQGYQHRTLFSSDWVGPCTLLLLASVIISTCLQRLFPTLGIRNFEATWSWVKEWNIPQSLPSDNMYCRLKDK